MQGYYRKVNKPVYGGYYMHPVYYAGLLYNVHHQMLKSYMRVLCCPTTPAAGKLTLKRLFITQVCLPG